MVCVTDIIHSFRFKYFLKGRNNTKQNKQKQQQKLY